MEFPQPNKGHLWKTTMNIVLDKRWNASFILIQNKARKSTCATFFCFLFFFFLFLGPHLWHMEVPRLGVKSKLQPPAYTTATPPPGRSCVCDLCLHHSSWQQRILNPLSEARDQTFILMDTTRIHFYWASHNGNSHLHYFNPKWR